MKEVPVEELRSEAEKVRRRIEELRAELYTRPGVAYEDAPGLHDELDRLVTRYVRLKQLTGRGS